MGKKSDLFYCKKCRTDNPKDFGRRNGVPYCKNCSDFSNYMNIKEQLLTYKKEKAVEKQKGVSLVIGTK